MLAKQTRTAIVLTLLLWVVSCLVYPGAVTAVAHLLFPHQANGSLVTRGGHPVGSELIGQPFAQPQYFHPRPSAAGNGYDPTASGGTNKGPTDRKLADTLVAQAVAAAIQDGAKSGQVPSDIATSSGSGLDPHVSPAGAALQVARVARTRGADSQAVVSLVGRYTEGRQFGFLGEPRVNVLELNLALDSAYPLKSH